MDTENYVAKLNEYSQRNRSVLSYEDVGSAGPDHIKTFTLRAVLNGKVYPDGVGKNKKEAKQNAAKSAWEGLMEETADATENTAQASTAPARQTGITDINFICWLNEYGHKNKLMIRHVETTRLGKHGATPCCSFVVGDKEYPAVSGKTRKEAKEEAAKLVYHELYGSKTTETSDEKHSGTSSKQNVGSNQNMTDICDQTKNLTVRTEDMLAQGSNFIGLVNHYCQKTNRSNAFIEERRSGPSHNPEFFYKLVINNKEYPVGEGKSIKEAKQNAAQLTWSALQEQSDWDSKITLHSALSDDGSPAKLFTSPSTLDSGHAKSGGVTTTTKDSVVFTNSSHPTKDQVKSPDVRPKIRIAAIFPNVRKNSKEDLMPDFKRKNTRKCRSEKIPSQLVMSRGFTSEFDSIERLGKGAFGRVFKAKQKLLEKYYAIKIVRCREKALREVKALSDLNHSNIVRYYYCWIEDSGYQSESIDDSCSTSQSSSDSSVKYLYIQMELCDTKTLRVWIDEKNTQNVRKSLQDSKRREGSLIIMQQIVSGVEYIHSKKLIHRDLKPANIMFGRDGNVKIGDFGLVTAEIEDDAENAIERTVFKGTPSYMAPEQKRRSPYDRKVDIFALGLIYFELLWNLSTDSERKAMWDDARNQKLPQRFYHHFHQEGQIIKSMLCVNPEDRPEASKLKTDLEEIKCSLTMLKNMLHDSQSTYQTLASNTLDYGIETSRLKTTQSEEITDVRDFWEQKSDGGRSTVSSAPSSLVLFTMDIGNYVAKLNEYAQKHRLQLHYEDLGSDGDDHNKTFTLRVVLGGNDYPQGVGKSKKDAKQNAAKNALSYLIGGEHQDSADSTEHAGASAAPVHQASINYICWLNQHGQKNRVEITYVETTRPGPINAVPFCSVKVGDKEYPAVSGKTKREAKENAAKLVHEEIYGSKTTETDDENYNDASAQHNEDINQNVVDFCNETSSLSVKDHSFEETNYKGLVNHYCQKTNRSHKYIEERRCGPPHSLKFFYKLVINNKEYPEGEGNSIKEAQQNAAQLAWSALQEQSDWDSQVSFKSTESEDCAPSVLSATTQDSNAASSQNMPSSTSDSIVFADSSNSSQAQVSLGSTESENNPSTNFSKSVSSRSFESSPQSMATDSSNSSNDQNAVKNNTSTQLRFTSEFDSIKRLGKGGFGRVYEARDRLLDKFHAVKIVSYNKKALREVTVLSDLQNRNIIRYYSCWVDLEYEDDQTDSSSTDFESNSDSSKEYLYIKMELCQDKTLKDWIQVENEKSPQDSKRRGESLRIVQQIVSGVEYIHSKNLIHRDLKPANIMFGHDEEVKIGDFGLVTAETCDNDQNLMERTKRTGTKSYMAPEQKSEKTYNQEVDMFALGLIFFELLWKLSTGTERAHIWNGIRSQKFPDSFSQTFHREYLIIKSLLCENPKERHGASALKAELEKYTQTFIASKQMRQENRTV
ncbi:interferon-induced, double-stranded RNA-activated protein kinase [Brachyistius frenatus]|uniref:interferon-induced, double-stranded RNA-activated protein kinase n=1 Tax=Brachyistius frenatus TaxID=100188 RepID=UPI0037E7142D